jgi:hypothetical protein
MSRLTDGNSGLSAGSIAPPQAPPLWTMKENAVLNLTRSLALATVVVGLLASTSVFAHHGANLYDMTKTVELKGTIAKFYWGNPHNEVAMDVADDKGTVVQWVAYTEPPLVMLERGWTRKSIPVGEKATMYVFAAKNGSAVGTLNRIVLANGTELTAYDMPRAAAPAPAK